MYVNFLRKFFESFDNIPIDDKKFGTPIYDILRTLNIHVTEIFDKYSVNNSLYGKVDMMYDEEIDGIRITVISKNTFKARMAVMCSLFDKIFVDFINSNKKKTKKILCIDYSCAFKDLDDKYHVNLFSPGSLSINILRSSDNFDTMKIPLEYLLLTLFPDNDFFDEYLDNTDFDVRTYQNLFMVDISLIELIMAIKNKSVICDQ